MLDAMVADKIHLQPDGIRARIGAYVWNVTMSPRDVRYLLEQENPVIYTDLEITSEQKPILTGFATQERKELYLRLRKIKGIGRKVGVLVLDCGEAIDILRAVNTPLEDDYAFFAGIPGLGAGRVGTVVVDLRKSYRHSLPTPIECPMSIWVEVRDALMTQGRSFREAENDMHDHLQPVPKTSEEFLSRF